MVIEKHLNTHPEYLLPRAVTSPWMLEMKDVGGLGDWSSAVLSCDGTGHTGMVEFGSKAMRLWSQSLQ